MEKHKVFVLKDREHSDAIAFIPTLRKVYLIAEKNESEVPEFVGTDENINENQLSLPPLKFDRSTIVITKNCNLGCVYCYENASPLFLSKNVMEWQVAKAAMDHVFSSTLEKNEVSGDNTCLINFFGGEPTIVWNILQKSVGYARTQSKKLGLNLRITLSTNGFFTDEKLDWLLGSIDAFNLSMDGPKEIHDSLRPTVRGGGSFERVFEIAKKIYKENSEKLLLRTTVSDKSVYKMTEIAKFFSKNFPGVVQAYEPIQGSGRAIDSVIEGPTIKLFLEQVLIIMPIIEARGGKIKISMIDFGNLGNSFCGVNGSNFIVTPEGLVTSCNRKMTENETLSEMFIFGKYNPQVQGFEFERKTFDWLKHYSIDNINECNKCFARYICRGGCPVIKSDSGGNFWKSTSNYCQEIKQCIVKILFFKLKK